MKKIIKNITDVFIVSITKNIKRITHEIKRKYRLVELSAPRITALVACLIASVCIGHYIIEQSNDIIKYYIKTYKIPNEYGVIIFRGMLYSIPPLPFLFILWLFRHIDTQDNLDRQEQNLYQNALFDAQRLMMIPDDSSKSFGILKLHRLLKEAPELKEDIYDALSAGLKQHPGWNKKLSLNIKKFDLREISFKTADLQGEDLSGVNLERLNDRMDLQHANLQNANLYYANLQNAYLYNALLRDVCLQSAYLQGAVFYTTDLRSANLQHATLQSGHTEATTFLHAIFNDKTVFPNRQKGDEFRQQATEEYGMKHEDDLTPEELKELNDRYK
ncbi:MAG: pentapeptide repeat-containing protein [Alphaproteobacteria bacterium]|nr:pentapeptide repeat-containing protein [Alphaproteobacteria bacterium]